MGLSNAKRLNVAEQCRAGTLTVAKAASRYRVSQAAVYRWVIKVRKLRDRFAEPAEYVHLVSGRPPKAYPALTARIGTRLKAEEAELRRPSNPIREGLKGHPKGQGPRLPMERIRGLVREEGFRGSESTLRRLLEELGIATEGQRQRLRARKRRLAEGRRISDGSQFVTAHDAKRSRKRFPG